MTDASGNVLTSYVFAGEHPLMRIENGVATYYMQDAMGSVLGLADADGESVASFQYDGFGNVRGATGSQTSAPAGVGWDFRYHGMIFDEATGLYHVRARTYDARVGRFLSRDPVAGLRRQPESMNPYVFAHSNPHVFVDPSGTFFTVSAVGIFVARAGEFFFRALHVAAGGAAEATKTALSNPAVRRILQLILAEIGLSTILDLWRGDDGDAGKGSVFHYTDQYLGVIEVRGVRPQEWWTDRGDLGPFDAYYELGIGKPGSSRPYPTHVIETALDSRFYEGPPLPGGGLQWTNVVSILPFSFVSVREL